MDSEVFFNTGIYVGDNINISDNIFRKLKVSI